ncbi:hypothetical protein QJQ45_000983 [Haematococcus lacustris]|nr:hypothetical protein QJQ45_000983 [Haematococcus lacustris]
MNQAFATVIDRQQKRRLQEGEDVGAGTPLSSGSGGSEQQPTAGSDPDHDADSDDALKPSEPKRLRVTISDRGATFNNQFWIEVRKLIGVDPAFSTAYHPQSDGQTERTNQIVEEMLRHYILPTQEDWPRHLAFAEFAINNSWQESIQSTPFLVNYGQSPITPVLHKLPRPCLSPSAESFAKKWEHEVKHAQECMRVAQDRQQRYANKRRRDVTFSVGDSVLLSTKNLRNAPGRARKFLPRYVGPFKVTGKLGEAAYRLELPPTMSRLHPVFHVSLLKKYTGSQGFHPPPVMEWLEDAPHYEVHSLLNHRQVRFKKRMEYLVKWTGYDDTYNTWEPEAMLAGAPQILSRVTEEVSGGLLPAHHSGSTPEGPVLNLGSVAGAEQLRQLAGERGLVDPWRHLHPSKRDLTHFSERWQTGACLDRWYVSEELVQWQMDSAIQGVLPVPTDHRPVSVAVCPPDLPLTVPAPWQLHPAHLDNPDLLDCLKDFLQAEALYHEAASQLGLPRDGHRARWARLKQGLAMRAQHFLRAQRRAQRDLQQRREKAAAVARAHLVRQLVRVEREGEAEVQAAQHLGEAAALAGVGAREQGAQQSLLASAVLDQYYGDRSSFFFYHRDQPAHTPTLISSLQLPGQPGHPADLTTPAGVKAACRAFQQHYSAAGPTGVYAAKPVDTAARAALLGSLTSHLTPTQARAAEGPDGSPMLSEEELGRALQGCAHSKAPGLDGLPMEVYDRLWVELGRPLRAMLQEALADTADPAPLAEFLTGIITLVPKAGKPRDQVAGYRPITLLNCDVRLVARAVEDRLQLPLDLLVSPSQSAFILGRDISDSVQFHLGLLEYLQQRGSPAWLLLLDLAGAYDNVSWGLLQETMEAMGFCREGHVRWAQLLHRGATSQVLVNGHLTDSFPLASGLLQGSGASPLYWCIVLQPLVSYLSSLQLAGRISTPTIPSSPLALHRAALTPALPSKEYADDLTIVVLDRVRDGKVVVEALGLFRAAGGPALSVSKSSALPCAQPEHGLGNQGGSGPEGAGRGGRGGDGGEGGGQGQVGEQGLGGGLGEGGGLGQQQGGREQGGEQEPEVVIPAVRAGVPVRHLGVPLGAASYAATSEAAFGGAAAAMMAASLPWRPQGLNLLGRVQVAQQCLASKSIYQMAFVQPSAPLAQAMALAVNRFVAASDLPQERSPNNSRLYPSKAICVMPRGEGGVGLPDLGVTSTAMLAKMLAQLWSPRVRPWQPLTHSLLADPSHGLSTWVITDPTAPPSRGISPRLQAHVAALAELKLFRAVPPASQSFFSVLAEPLWYNAQVRMNPAAREAAAQQGWTHVRHVREALHSPQLEGDARWAADLVRACLPEPWQGMVDRLQPPQPEWECLRVGPGVGFVMRRHPLLQPSHWVGPNGRLYPLDPTGQGPLGAFWAEGGAAWEPAAVARLNKPSYRLTPEERATHLRPLPAQHHVAQEQA